MPQSRPWHLGRTIDHNRSDALCIFDFLNPACSHNETLLWHLSPEETTNNLDTAPKGFKRPSHLNMCEQTLICFGSVICDSVFALSGCWKVIKPIFERWLIHSQKAPQGKTCRREWSIVDQKTLCIQVSSIYATAGINHERRKTAVHLEPGSRFFSCWV